MSRIYEHENFEHFLLQKESKSWLKSKVISEEQYKAIAKAYPTRIYQPPFFLQVVLFIATSIGISSVTSLFGIAILSNNFEAAPFLSFIYGIGLFVFLDRILYKNLHHYNSGVSEAFLYSSLGFMAYGFFEFVEATNMNVYFIFAISLVLAIAIAYRYLKLEASIAVLGILLALLFYISNDIGGVAMHLLPFTICTAFIGVYFLIQALRREDWSQFYKNHFVVGEFCCLVLVYASMNYFVVREMSVELIGLELENGKDIPFAFLFYVATLGIPIFYLIYGIRSKSMLFIRTSLLVFACGVFTFKYYFSMGHPEISLTIAGAVLLLISVTLMRYLKTPRNGFTRELILKNSLANANLEAFIINNAMSVNAPVDTGNPHIGHGGEFGGGGASGEF